MIANVNVKSLLLVSLLAVAGCATATPEPVSNPVIMQVKTTVEKEKLVTNPACTDYLLTKSAQPGVDLVEVMEKHGGACPGDAQVQHRLFSVYVDQKTKQMASDKDDPEEGNLKLLSPAG
ncbi:MAG TPA: hypothetical protein DEF05_04055 [Erwinia sp.]|nr:hypothetical protein [Erwinia sp.]HBV38872.1 hypothetical protein [Erwinia sp.]